VVQGCLWVAARRVRVLGVGTGGVLLGFAVWSSGENGHSLFMLIPEKQGTGEWLHGLVACIWCCFASATLRIQHSACAFVHPCAAFAAYSTLQCCTCWLCKALVLERLRVPCGFAAFGGEASRALYAVNVCDGLLGEQGHTWSRLLKGCVVCEVLACGCNVFHAWRVQRVCIPCLCICL
jgi:hypothetical protein